MTDREVHSAVVRWFAQTTGLPVIKTEQSGNLPPLPYIAISLTGLAEVRDHAQDYIYAEDAETDRVIGTTVIETEWRFSVHAYGDSPTDILRPVRSAAQIPQASEPLMPALVVHDVSEIRYIPEYMNEGWEPRAQMDFILRGLVKDGFVIDKIEQFSFKIEQKQ